jgi:hypothetical protein
MPFPLSIKEMISPTSMTVTASASISVPNGSPTRIATTSAWCTAAITLPRRTAASTSAKGSNATLPIPSQATIPSTGRMTVCSGSRFREVLATPSCTFSRRPVQTTYLRARSSRRHRGAGIASNNGIAAGLNRLGIPTLSGGGAKWHGTSVGNLRRRLAASPAAWTSPKRHAPSDRKNKY